MQQHMNRLYNKFLLFLELQLLISIVTTPFLIGWGLPLSTISIVGNLFFSPFLTIFICVSSFIFITDIFGISNIFLQNILNTITYVWCILLSYGSPSYLIVFENKLLPIASIVALLACSIYYNKIACQKSRLCILLIMSTILPVVSYIQKPFSKHHKICNGRKNFYIILYKDQIYAIDLQALGAKKGYESWIEYTLIPEIIKHTGFYKIDCLITTTPTQRSQQAVYFLSQHLSIKRIIPLKQTILPPNIEFNDQNCIK